MKSAWLIIFSTKQLEALLFLLLIILTGVTAAEVNPADVQQELLQRLEGTETAGELTVRGHRLMAGKAISRLYIGNRLQPLWSQQAIEQLVAAITPVDEEGLVSSDYFLADIMALAAKKVAGGLGIKESVDLEILSTAAFGRMAFHFRFGKVDPVSLDSNWNFDPMASDGDPVAKLAGMIRSGNISKSLQSLLPSHRFYHALRDLLAFYKKVQSAGGWQEIPAGKAIKPSADDERVPLIAKRLAAVGLLSGRIDPAGQDTLYDKSLQQAVRRFQHLHGLEEDGIIGTQTIAEMNLPVKGRINQIRVNLERVRWLMHDIEGDFLFVNLPAFKAVLVRNGEIIWDTKVQVGKAYTKTPVFKDEIKYLVFNPTWTIPPGILRRSIVPNVKKNPDYLNQKGYWLLDRKGNRLDPLAVDWANTKGFPFIVRQPPGPDNALGVVKFIFPNPYYVFLHDTNHREHFASTMRSFSSGCVRVQDPLYLAELLLKGKSGWDRGKIDRTVSSGNTTTVFLDKPMTVMLAYATVEFADGEVIFRQDVYGRDAAVLKSLDGDVRIPKKVTHK